MIFYRTSGYDSNPNNQVTPGCALNVPVGVKNGDLIVVEISSSIAPGVTYAPPDASWHQVVQTDPSIATGALFVFWKIAQNEANEWVFAASSPCQSLGAVIVFGGVNALNPIEAVTVAQTASSANHNIPAAAPNLDNDLLLLCLGATASGTWTQIYNNAPLINKSESQGSVGFQWLAVQAATPQAATTTFFSGAGPGEAAILVIRANPGTLSQDDARNRVLEGLPDGAADVYDLDPGGDFFNYYDAIADVLRIYGFNLADMLRREASPATAFNDLGDWERVLGLQTTKTAKLGTVTQRQQQVISAWRSAAGQTLTAQAVQAAIGLLAGYSNPSQLQLLNVSRTGLDAVHSYGPGTLTFNAGAAFSVFTVPDSGVISQGGVRLKLVFDVAPSTCSVVITSPGATTGSIVIPASQLGTTIGLFLPSSFIGTQFSSPSPNVFPSTGTPSRTWLVAVTVTGASTTVTPTVIVEGIGRTTPLTTSPSWGPTYDALGAAAFEWGVFIDPTKVNGGGGGSVDYNTIRNMLLRLQRAHTIVRLIRGSATVSPGQPLAIPNDNNCIPDQVIPS